MKKIFLLATLTVLIALNLTLISDLRAKDSTADTAGAQVNEEMWADLKTDLYDDRKINKTATWLKMEAPYRAHDAALVPITIKAKLPNPEGKETSQKFIKTLTLVIDNNPVPVAAKIQLSSRMGPLHMETRIRINQYSHVRAIVETNDGELFMVAKYVKAAGGCSAPAMKDIDAKMASLGKIKLRQFSQKPKTEKDVKRSTVNTTTREIQLMVRHPNYSGMQLNQVTGYYIPAHFVNDMEVELDGSPLLKIEGAISLSEDPTIRFKFQTDKTEPTLNFLVRDTKDQIFKKEWQLKSILKAGS